MLPNSPSSGFDRASAPSPSFAIDEGFSEDTRSGNGSPAPESMDVQTSQGLPARRWLLAQSHGFRAAIARELLSSLPNSTVSDIVHEANARLHFDPVLCLPHEIISDIFEYLPSETLLNASMVSQTWRELAMEPPLWRRLFRLEGWTHDKDNVRLFEDNSRSQIERIWSNPRVRPRPADFGTDRLDVKRTRFDNPTADTENDVRLWVEHGSLDVPPGWTDGGHAQRLETNPGKQAADFRSRNQNDMIHDTTDSNSNIQDNIMAREISEQAVCPLLKPSRLIDTITEPPRPNWHWIFKQRRRLEKNWNAGSFTNFRLPRLDHKEEGHSQCVYTLQFSPKHLVSGSRDKSVRVWDLDTRRLKMPPLVGHSGSVLCLQFDERPGKNLIISGSSDADVMIWQFSTGRVIKRLRRAHAESVLNLRFDDRYLVTCSKDKTIKLWNMKELRLSDPEYPRQNTARDAYYPDHIINLSQMVGDPRRDLVEPLPLYSLIMTFEGHNAAVNAIQIFENHIVSASGDRMIILWDISSGSLVRKFSGHLKGIACVQYDGRRIVSGSSDNTVRIFDSATGAEVATLEGHRHLVRTVQAEFGDMYDDTDTLEAEARQNDRRIINDRARMATLNHAPAPSQRHFVFGARLPPGGGGNRWSKIVSGSYDQTVIIWRRDNDGGWKIAKQLRQEEALRATAGESQDADQANEHPPTTSLPDMPPPDRPHVTQPPLPPVPLWGGARQNQYVPGFRPFVQHQQINHSTSSQQRRSTGQDRALQPPMSPPNDVNQAQAEAEASNSNGANINNPNSHPTHRDHHSLPTWEMQHQINAAQVSQPAQVQTSAHLHPQNPRFPHPPPPHLASSNHHRQHIHNVPNHLPGLAPLPDDNNPLVAVLRQAQALEARAAPLGQAQTPEALERDASRVFRLQFDARRIISSSQLPVIVGWDFANGDRDIEEASQFFGEPA